jgi:hypothetical protein
MNWSSALTGLQWAVLVAVPPLVFLLYFLKLRRKPIEVPSTYLWKRALEDVHVNSLWQRLKKNLLLLLQLLFLIALIIACLRPSRFGDLETGRRWILLIDNSASMSSREVEPDRLSVAKSKAREQLSKMNRGDIAMVIAFSDRADIRHGFTDDRNRLLEAIDSVEATQKTTDIREALRASSGLANPGRKSFDGKNDIQVAEALPATVFIYSDGDFTAFNEFDKGNLAFQFVPIGVGSKDNVAIEAFSAEREEEADGKIRVFARLANYGQAKGESMVSLYREDQLVDAVSVAVEPGGEKGLAFTLDAIDDKPHVYRLDWERKDQLPLDNVAYAVLKPSRRLRIAFYTPGNNGLERSLATNAVMEIADVVTFTPDKLESDATLQKQEQFDLVIYDQCVPTTMPNANTLFIGRIPPMETWKKSELTGPLQILDVDRSHPITEFLEIGNLQIVEGFTVQAPDGGQTLIQGATGPLMSIAPRGPFQDAVLGFELVRTEADKTLINTNWTIKRSFPIFMMACVEHLAGGISTSSSVSVQPGRPVTIRLAGRLEEAIVERPNKTSTPIERNSSGLFIWTDTEQSGAYQIVDTAGQVLDSFAVNLFSPAESRLQSKASIEIGEEKIAATSSTQRGRIEYWRWLLLGGLVVLVGEWTIYNRRVLI